MIPRLKPSIGIRELMAALRLPKHVDVEQFEQSFAQLMGQKYAFAFPYGRTGLMLLLEALGLKSREIICPAYTCAVVPHAITYSGNTPVFIDCESGGFNMDLSLAEEAITEKTGAIIATSIFGYPVNLECLDGIRDRHPNVYIIQDCAHSFAAEWNGRPVQKEGVAALFGLNISKTLTSIFGGMITTDNEDIYQRLKTLRGQKLNKPSWVKSIRRLIYFFTVYPTFWEPLYGLINRLERLGLLNYFVRYYDETKVVMPYDYLEAMCGVEARVGAANINRYETIIRERRASTRYYFEHLVDKPDFKLPPEIEGATYSHFAVQVGDREQWLRRAIRKGIQLGWLIEYSIPEMATYGKHRPEKFPVAAAYARSMINLPVWGGPRVASVVVRNLFKKKEG